jgi:hypothetical protein
MSYGDKKNYQCCSHALSLSAFSRLAAIFAINARLEAVFAFCMLLN